MFEFCRSTGSVYTLLERSFVIFPIDRTLIVLREIAIGQVIVIYFKSHFASTSPSGGLNLP